MSTTTQERVPLPTGEVPEYAEAISRHLSGGDTRGALLPLLHALQEEFGHLDDAMVPQVAEALNLSRADVHGVITFYHDFRRQPAGRHVVRLCRAESCQARGGAAIERAAVDRLTARMASLVSARLARERATLANRAASLDALKEALGQLGLALAPYLGGSK